MIPIKPVPPAFKPAERMQTIRSNIRNIATYLAASKDRLTEDKLEYMTRAVRIVDEESRRQFVALIESWASLYKLRIEAHEALQTLNTQLGEFSEPLIEENEKT